MRLSSILRLRAELIGGAGSLSITWNDFWLLAGSVLAGFGRGLAGWSGSMYFIESLELLLRASHLISGADSLLSSFFRRSLTEGIRARWLELDNRLPDERVETSWSSLFCLSLLDWRGPLILGQCASGLGFKQSSFVGVLVSIELERRAEAVVTFLGTCVLWVRVLGASGGFADLELRFRLMNIWI